MNIFPNKQFRFPDFESNKLAFMVIYFIARLSGFNGYKLKKEPGVKTPGLKPTIAYEERFYLFTLKIG
jgi:hypothetical protein